MNVKYLPNYIAQLISILLAPYIFRVKKKDPHFSLSVVRFYFIFSVANKMRKLPVSKFPIIVSSPNRAFFQIDFGGITPFLSNLRKSHECVVCSFLPLFKNTDMTSGCSCRWECAVFQKCKTEENKEKAGENRGKQSRVNIAFMKMKVLLAISAASLSSRIAAKPLICLVYEYKMASFAFSSLR